jgi:hypothetical protein
MRGFNPKLQEYLEIMVLPDLDKSRAYPEFPYDSLQYIFGPLTISLLERGNSGLVVSSKVGWEPKPCPLMVLSECVYASNDSLEWEIKEAGLLDSFRISCDDQDDKELCLVPGRHRIFKGLIIALDAGQVTWEAESL